MSTLAFVALLALVFVIVWALVYVIAPPLFKLMNRLAGWSAERALGTKLLADRRHHVERWRVFLPVATIVAGGVIVAIIAGDAFLDLVELLQTESPAMQEADRLVHERARYFRDDPVTMILTIATIIGTPVGLGIIVAITSAFAAYKKQYRWIAYLAFTGIGGGFVNLALKSYFARERPLLSEALRDAHGYSFPSGHAMGSMVVFGALSYVAFRSFTTWRARSLAIAAAFTMIFVICASRIYLGVHWISDIAAGVSAGALWVAATTTAYETFRRLRRVRMMREGAES